jgi:hypothetical protein
MNAGLLINIIKAESEKYKAESKRKRYKSKVESKGLSYECRLVDQCNKRRKGKA